MDPRFIALLTLAAAVDAIVAASILFAPVRASPPGEARGLGLLRAFAAAVALSLLAVVRSWAVMWFGAANVFGVMHMLYLDLVVVVPVLGAAALLAARSRAIATSPAVHVLAVCCVLPALLGAYATFVEPKLLQLERATVEIDVQRTGSAPLMVGIVSDIQTSGVTSYERKAISRMMALEPDMILLPGDLFQDTEDGLAAETPKLRALLMPLDARGGVYMVGGNVDRPGSLEAVLEGTNIRLLDDQSTTVQIDDRTVSIVGVGLWSPEPARVDWLLTQESLEGSDIRILLSHYPDVALDLPDDSRFDLVVAGHTHGGQVRVPLLGPAITLSRVPRFIAAGGLHALAGNSIYVSRGVGIERGQAPRLRFLCPPEITLLTLE